MKIYRSRKDKLLILSIAGFALLPAAIFLSEIDELLENPFILVPLLTPLALLLWLVFDTYYTIEDHKLKYHSGFVNGEIDIRKIREIVKGKTLWIGIKPALARNGLIVKYNRFDEIYISPEGNDEMISDLIDVNREITVTEGHEARG